MATPTYTPIESKTLTSTTTNVTFNSIPSTYTDLILIVNSIPSNGNAETINLTFNGDTSTSYSYTRLVNASSGRASNVDHLEFLYYNNTNPNNTCIIQIQNYSNSSVYKTVLGRAYSPLNVASVEAEVGLWRNTNAITSLNVNFYWGAAAGSTFTLYGIANAAIGAPKATGGIITYDDTYFYHTFGASGTFTPQQSLTVDYLVIAGGGGGGNNHGGGGAGGLRSTVTVTGGGGSLESPLSLTAQAYTVTVGAGGVGQTYANRSSVTSGGNSTFSTITSTGGGYGANDARAAATGGSGGGGAAGGTTGASGTANQGYAGGNAGNSGAILNGGGGGGAGAVGGNGNSGTNVAGNGGVGVAIPSISNITGTGVATYYAGGGGGSSQTGTPGTGGLGGGGNAGLIEAVASSGVVNTGGGGGASVGGSGTSGNGGSGVVIIRYLKA